jgi:CHASE2 domain-containing sensor protein
VLVTGTVLMGSTGFGVFGHWSCLFFDQMMQLRPDEKAEMTGVLIVERDTERYQFPLSSKRCLRAIEKLNSRT